MEESDDVSEFKEKYGNLGALRIEFWRCQCLETLSKGSFSTKYVGVVPEKALKGQPLDVASRLVRRNSM